MRKLILFFILLFTSVALFAQEVIPDIGDWKALYENFFALMATWVGVAGIAIFLGEFFIRVIPIVRKFWKKTIVILLAVVFSFLGMAANIGYLSEAVWYETVIWGIATGLIASGIWSQNFAFLKTLIELLIGFIKDKEPKFVR